MAGGAPAWLLGAGAHSLAAPTWRRASVVGLFSSRLCAACRPCMVHLSHHATLAHPCPAHLHAVPCVMAHQVAARHLSRRLLATLTSGSAHAGRQPTRLGLWTSSATSGRAERNDGDFPSTPPPWEAQPRAPLDVSTHAAGGDARGGDEEADKVRQGAFSACGVSPSASQALLTGFPTSPSGGSPCQGAQAPVHCLRRCRLPVRRRSRPRHRGGQPGL